MRAYGFTSRYAASLKAIRKADRACGILNRDNTGNTERMSPGTQVG